MKKKILGLVSIIGIISLVGCDKINPEEYTIYDGAVVNWIPNDSYITPVQRVYVEKFTGPRCNNCPMADATLAGIHNDNVVMVSINHPTGQGIPYPDQPDMRTDGGTVWDKYFGINAIPSAYINRDMSTQYQGDMSNIVGDINQALTANPTVALNVHAYNQDNEVHIDVLLKYVRNYTKPVTLTVALIEDSLRYRQLLPDNSIDDNYIHNHMLRKVITGFWGADVDATGVEGETKKGGLKFTIDNDITLDNSHIVAFISDKATRKVLNCASCKIDIE